MVKAILTLSAVAGITLLGGISYYVLGPVVDNWLQVIAPKDLATLQRYPVSGMPLESLVARKYSIQSWSAYHEDWIFATRVDCQALDKSGRSLLLSWEVRHGNPPRDWMPKRQLYITPLSRPAAEISPALLPSGVLPEDLPLSRYGAGFVYDVAHSRASG